MDPLNPASFRHYTTRLSTGRTYHFVDEGPRRADDPTLLCIHGFPDSWYAWRRLIRPWTARGLRVIAPDMLGYGDTDKPRAASEYSTRKLSADLAALLDHLGVSKAVVVGHDWGAYTAGRFALWHPDRLRALVLLSVPFTPPVQKYIPLETVVAHVPAYAYQAYFASREATAEIEANLPHFLDAMYERWSPTNHTQKITIGNNMRACVTGALPGRPARQRLFVSDAEIRYTVDRMRDMNGPLNYYRTTKDRFDEEDEANLSSRLPIRSTTPVLFIYGSRDPTSTPERLPKARKSFEDYSEVKLEGMGHWLMLEAAEEVEKAIGGWLVEKGIGGERGEKARM